MYSFAGPRVGDPIFVEKYRQLIEMSWRVVNTHDEVPKVPFAHIFFEHYKHVPKEVPITFGNGLDLVEDHRIVNYINKLEELKSK